MSKHRVFLMTFKLKNDKYLQWAPRKPQKNRWVLWCFQHRGSRGRPKTRLKHELEIGCVLGVNKCQNFQFAGGAQCAKIPPCLVPRRSYTVSNNTLEWSDGCA